MKILNILSKKYGSFKVKLDNEDYERLKSFKTMKWCARFCKHRHNLIYFQKRLSNKKLIELHRWVMNFPKGKTVDHINNNTLDNRKCNLRICNNSTNIRNGRIRINNKSGHTGVRFRRDRDKWYATIRVNYKIISLGAYKNKEDAINVRKQAELKYFNI
jgi:hypothetical protein